MAESTIPCTGNPPVTSEVVGAGPDASIPLGLARVGTLRVGDPLASQEPETEKSTSTDQT